MSHFYENHPFGSGCGGRGGGGFIRTLRAMADAADGGGRGPHRGRSHGRGGFGGPPGRRGGRRTFESGALRIAVLQLIAETPRHGYDIIRSLEARLHGTYAPSPGAIYPLLQMFEEADYVTSEQDGAKKRYSITEAGLAYLEENKDLAERLDAQINRASERMRGAEVGGSMRAFRSTLFRALRGGDLTTEQIERVRDILDAARQQIEEV